MNLSLHPAALAELQQARDYYLHEASAIVAERFLAQFDQATRSLLEYPELGHPVSTRLRALPLRQFPYSLIYQRETQQLTILALAHQRRRPGYWAKRR